MEKSDMKMCKNKDCSQVNPQPLTAFSRHPANKDRLQTQCKSCKKKSFKEYYADPNARVASAHSHLKRKYNLTPEQYDQILKDQGGVCAVCNGLQTVVDKRANKIRAFAVDHCHKTGRIRGLLCDKCNRGIGDFNDSLDRLQSAIVYLRRHS